MKRILSTLLLPFTRDLWLFASLWLLASAADLFYWTMDGWPGWGLYMSAHGMVMSYVVTLFCSLMKGKWRRRFIFIFTFLGFANLVIDAGTHSILGYGFTKDLVASVIGTNPGETSDFFSTFVTPQILMYICGISALVVFFWAHRREGHDLRAGFLAACIMLSVTVGCGIWTAANRSHEWGSVYLGKVGLFLSYKPVMNVHKYSKDYEMEQVRECEPQKVVLVIGESLTRDHMSLYGYDHRTTPKLEARVQNDSMVVYSDARSPWMNTVPVFKYLMTGLHENESDEEWRHSPMLLDVVRSSGYFSEWISNQSPVGAMGDNEVAALSRIADRTRFCGSKIASDYDEILLPTLRKALREQPKGSYDFMVVHLMGQHEAFHNRYPGQYDVFKEEDYSSFPKGQRLLRSEYDNSILYNDSVVDSIISEFEDKNAIVIYFSDHAIDVFESSSDYCGHARLNDDVSVEAGKRVPFMVWGSPKFRAVNPELWARIQQGKDRPAPTADLFYTLMDVMGTQMEGDTTSVATFSLFRSND